MRTLAAVFLLAGAARAQSDPAGTVPLRLKPGETFSLEAPPGSNVLCDDLGVVAPEFRLDEKGFLLRARQPGETLCGVWLAEAKPGGLYRVTVAPEEKSGADAGPPRGTAGESLPPEAGDGGTPDDAGAPH